MYHNEDQPDYRENPETGDLEYYHSYSGLYCPVEETKPNPPYYRENPETGELEYYDRYAGLYCPAEGKNHD